MNRPVRNPFLALLGLEPVIQPKIGSATLVIDGRKVGTEACIASRPVAASADLEDEAQRLRERRAELNRIRDHLRCQCDTMDPDAMSKWQAWIDAHKEWRREYKRNYDARNIDRKRQQNREWARRKYHEDPDAWRAKKREWTRAKAKRDACAPPTTDST